MSLFDSGTDYDTATLLPNRYDRVLGVTVVLCPCGDTPAVRSGKLAPHFPPMHNGAALQDPFLPGTAACRYSGRTVTLAAAIERDEQLTDAERPIRGAVRNNPSAWLGLLDWVDFQDVKVGDRVAFTVREYDERGPRVYEREGVVDRTGATFVSVACVPDALGTVARLKRKDWESGRVRRKD